MSFPAYPVYKDSGVEWLGDVPEHWTITLLKRGYEVVLGKMLQPDARCDDDEFLPYLRAANIQLSGVDTVDVKYMWFSAEEKRSLLLRRGDLLVSEGGDVGRSAIWDFDGEECYFQNSINRVRSIGGNNTRFLYFWMMAIKNNGYIDIICNKSTIAHFTAEKVAAVPLLIPAKSEQAQIARFLDHETARIDALIEEQQRLIELLREKHQAVISQAVTKGLDPAVPMKDSGVEWLGDVPAHWSVVPFGLACGYQEGPGIMAVDFRDEGVPLVRISGVQGRWVTLQGCNYLDSVKVDGKWGHFRLERGDLIISGSASMGLVSEVSEEAVGAVAYTGLIRLVPKVGISDRDFIRSVVGSYQFFAQIDLLKAGSTIQHFGPTHLSQMRVVLPPLDEQIRVAAYVDRVSVQFDQLLDVAVKTNDLLQERRSALISAAVTGKIDVRSWLPAAIAPSPVLAEEAA